MNASPSGFIGCSVTFAIHLIASMVSRRPIAFLLTTSILGGIMAVSVAATSTTVPPPPPVPSVPAMAYVKTVK
jgi:hypothetical protein